MKLSEITVRWYDVVFFVGFLGFYRIVVYNYLGDIAEFLGLLVMMSYIWFMSKRQQSNPESDSDAGSS